MIVENLIISTKEEILTITINRESKLNALNKKTLAELSFTISEAQKNSAIGAIIITGAGNKAFVAGADIAEFTSLTITEGKDLAKNGQTVFDLIENSNKPIIAAINGFALGGGLELALACHIRVASENAKLGLPEVSLGLIPGYGGTQRLTNLVGKGIAFEMILSGEMITATEAHRVNLVNHVVSPEQLLTKAKEIANKMLSRSPEAISAAIKSINASKDNTVNGYRIEIDEFGKCFGTANFKEGASAFLEKRKPKFKRH